MPFFCVNNVIDGLAEAYPTMRSSFHALDMEYSKRNILRSQEERRKEPLESAESYRARRGTRGVEFPVLRDGPPSKNRVWEAP